jgi:hypothetical protein
VLDWRVSETTDYGNTGDHSAGLAYFGRMFVVRSIY